MAPSATAVDMLPDQRGHHAHEVSAFDNDEMRSMSGSRTIPFSRRSALDAVFGRTRPQPCRVAVQIARSRSPGCSNREMRDRGQPGLGAPLRRYRHAGFFIVASIESSWPRAGLVDRAAAATPCRASRANVSSGRRSSGKGLHSLDKVPAAPNGLGRGRGRTDREVPRRSFTARTNAAEPIIEVK